MPTRNVTARVSDVNVFQPLSKEDLQSISDTGKLPLDQIVQYLSKPLQEKYEILVHDGEKDQEKEQVIREKKTIIEAAFEKYDIKHWLTAGDYHYYIADGTIVLLNFHAAYKQSAAVQVEMLFMKDDGHLTLLYPTGIDSDPYMYEKGYTFPFDSLTQTSMEDFVKYIPQIYATGTKKSLEVSAYPELIKEKKYEPIAALSMKLHTKGQIKALPAVASDHILMSYMHEVGLENIRHEREYLSGELTLKNSEEKFLVHIGLPRDEEERNIRLFDRVPEVTLWNITQKGEKQPCKLQSLFLEGVSDLRRYFRDIGMAGLQLSTQVPQVVSRHRSGKDQEEKPPYNRLQLPASGSLSEDVSTKKLLEHMSLQMHVLQDRMKKLLEHKTDNVYKDVNMPFVAFILDELHNAKVIT